MIAPQREQHPLLVVADHARRAGGQHELAAVASTSDCQEADLVLVGRAPGRRRRARRARPRPRRRRAGDERVRRPRSAGTPSVTMRCSGGCAPAREVRADRASRGSCRRRRARARPAARLGPGSSALRRRVREQPAGPARRAEPRPGQHAPRSRADDDLARRRRPSPSAVPRSRRARRRSARGATSRRGSRCTSPLCMPSDMRSVTAAPSVSSAPDRRAAPRACRRPRGTRARRARRRRRAAAARRRRTSAGRRRCAYATSSSAAKAAADGVGELLGALAARAGRAARRAS